jgi:hypothetical protein
MEKKKGRGGSGGSKLNRSETVTMRLDPKLRYLTELAARQHRRTVSSFIEWAIERQLDHVILFEDYDFHDRSTSKVSLADEAQKLWDIDEPDRIAKLALHYPELLSYEEQVIWKLIRECGYLWKGTYDQQGYWTWEVKPGSLDFNRLRTHWETFKQVAAGEADKDSLPHWEEREFKASKLCGELPIPSDDDIPF